MPKYYALEKKEQTADLYIFGDISEFPWREKDRDAYSIVKDLQALEATELNVHINSYGGDVSEGLAIYNTLKNSPAKVTTYCDGFACSAASVIFMAGDERIMNSASLLMIHNAWSYGYGNANEFRKQAEDLDKITQASINAYMAHVNLTEKELKEKMDAESWITAQEALEDGFATRILEEDAEGVNQSAFRVIRNKLLAEPDGIAPAQLGATELVIDEGEMGKFAGKVAEKLKDLLDQEGQQVKNQKESAGWDAFFNTRKGEEK